MRLCDFASMLFPYLGKGRAVPEYMRALFDLLIDETDADFTNPLYDLTPDYINRIYNGRENLAKTKASAILNHLDILKFTNGVHDDLTPDAEIALGGDIQKLGLSLSADEVPEQCAEIFVDILKELARSTKKKSAQSSALPNGKVSLSQVPVASLKVIDGKIEINGQVIVLHEKLKPPEDIAPDELPYVTALFEAYAQAEQLDTVTKDTLDSLPKKYRRNFVEQRESYYNADSVFHSLRECVIEGEDEIQRIKDDTYDGISDTCWDDYKDGYARLIAVLKQVARITLTKSYLASITNLINTSERKGICHMLVNDGRIQWVVDDE